MSLLTHFLPRFLLLLSFLHITSCSKNNTPAIPTLTGLTMGTSYTIKINESLPGDTINSLNLKIVNILENINNEMSTYIDDSALSRINKSKNTDWHRVPVDLYEVLHNAISISKLSGGAFDITVGPLVNAWGFGPAEKLNDIPDKMEIKNMLSHTGYKNLKIRTSPPSVLKMHPDIYIDLSAIAKGYAVDKISDLLNHNNLNNYMVEIGGEIYATGVNEKNEPWIIGIQSPDDMPDEVINTIQLVNMGMATSGDYRNFFVHKGKRYSHTINPVTGYPVEHNLVSVTVLHESVTIADALATAMLVMGPVDGFNLAVDKRVAAYFIIKKETGYQTLFTESFRPFIKN